MPNRNPALWANPTNRPAKLWNLTWDQVLAVDGAVWKTVLILLADITLMWVLNFTDNRAWNIPLTLIGYLGIYWVGLRPTFLFYSAPVGGLLAALFDRDKSQGIGSGPGYLFEIVRMLSYCFLLLAYVLITIPFWWAPLVFWVLLFGVIILLQTGDALGGWRVRIITAWVLICTVFGLWALTGIYAGNAFDDTRGAPQYMMHPDSHVVDNRRPEDCAPEGVNLQTFNFREEGKCTSTLDGVQLVPITPEVAKMRSLQGWSVLAAEDATVAKAAAAEAVGADIPWALILGGIVTIAILAVLLRFVGGTVGGVLGTLLKLVIGLLILFGLVWLAVVGFKAVGWMPGAKAAEMACSAPKPPEVPKFGEMFRLLPGCSQQFNTRDLPFDSSGRPLFTYDAAGFGDRAADEVVQYHLSGKLLTLTADKNALAAEGLPSIHVGFCALTPTRECNFPAVTTRVTSVAEAAAAGPADDSGIDPEKAEAAIK